jgi:hypothetical protein
VVQAKHQKFIDKATFLGWWKTSGQFLSLVYADSAKGRLLTQFLSLWYWWGGEGGGRSHTRSRGGGGLRLWPDDCGGPAASAGNFWIRRAPASST